MAKQIKFNDEARASMKKGIDILAEAVTMTLGPRGRAVVMEKGYGAPQVTLDGVTVAKEIELEGKFENLGAEFIKQAAEKTNDAVGDGTTTSVVLAHTMINKGEELVKGKGFNVILLAEELKKGSESIIKELEKQRELINDNQKIKEVATLSAKDPEIGGLIAEVMGKIGKEGVVTVEDSNAIGNSYEMVEGMSFDRGYISAYMVSNQEKMEATLDEPYVLVTDKKISSINELLPLLEKIVQGGKKELFIVAEDVEGEALATLILNKLRGIVNVLAVKAPGFGDRKKEVLQDICIVTGAQFIAEDLGRKLDSVTIEDLGSAHRIFSTKDTTTVVGGKGEKKAIEERVRQIKAQLTNTDSEFEKEKFQERLGKLAGGVAVIKVGAPTESAQKELKQRVDDALHATRAAMEEGIVPGGGMALLNITLADGDAAKDSSVSEAARKIILESLEAPVRALIANSGGNPDEVLAKLKTRKNPWEGFNAGTNSIEDLKAAGIIDPLKVTKTAFINAVSVAATYLTIGAAITEIPEEKKEAPHGHGMEGMY